MEALAAAMILYYLKVRFELYLARLNEVLEQLDNELDN